MGRLKLSRYSSWKHGRLQNALYQGFSAAAAASSLTTASTRRADLLHLAVVGLLDDLQRLLHRRHRLRLAARRQQNLAEQAGPAVLHQILLERLARDHGGEIVHALALPAGLQALCPGLIRRPVIAHADRGRRALEDVELFRRAAEMRHALHGGRAGADDADALVGKTGETAFGIAAGVGVIPAAGVEAVALETFDAGNAGQLRPAQRTACENDEARTDAIAAIGLDQPASPPAPAISSAR